MATEKAVVTQQYLTDIADAIRAKGGTTNALLPSQMAGAIGAIPSGGSGGWVKQPWKNDGKLHIWIVVERVDTAKDRAFVLITYASGYVIDWGDGSTSVTNATRNNHSYSKTGTYCVTLNATDSYRGASTPWFTSYSGTGYPLLGYSASKVRQIELGNCTAIGGNSTFGAFWSLSELRYLKWTTSNITTIPTRCFADAIALYEIDGMTAESVEQYAFSGCRCLVTDVSSQVNSISQNSFAGCVSIETATVPDTSTFTNVPAYVYQNCTSIWRVVIPAAITYVSYSAFDGCSSLREIVFKPTTPPTLQNANAFARMPADCVVTVPKGTLAAYKAAANYTNIAKYMVEADE